MSAHGVASAQGSPRAPRIVLLFVSGGDGASALASEASHLAQLMADDPRSQVAVISSRLTRLIPGATGHVRLDSAPRSAWDRTFAALGVFALRARLARYPLGRLLNTLGPVDEGRVWWRTLRRHAEARELLRWADVVIATDIEATKAARRALTRGWVDRALYDQASGSVGASWQLPGTTAN